MNSARERAEQLLSVVRAHADEGALRWLERGLPAAGQPLQRGLFFGFYAVAGRRFAGRFEPSEAELSQLSDAGVGAAASWDGGQLVRAALLLLALDVLPDEEYVGLVREAINKGDTGERVAALRALSLLPGPERFLELAVDSCRSHVQDVFDAVACDNPYAARHFPEPSFNQMIMKALFTEVPLSRVMQWQSRVNLELSRMARDYEAERRAAGRTVPEDIARIHESLERTQENAP